MSMDFLSASKSCLKLKKIEEKCNAVLCPKYAAADNSSLYSRWCYWGYNEWISLLRYSDIEVKLVGIVNFNILTIVHQFVLLGLSYITKSHQKNLRNYFRHALPNRRVSSSSAVTSESVQQVFVLSMEMRTDAQSAGECGSCSAECAATRPLASRSDAARPPGPVAAPAPPPPSSHLWKGNFELV